RGRCANVGARRSSDSSHRLAGVLQRPLKTEVRVVRCRAEWPPGRRAEPAHRHGLRHGDAADRIGFNFINRGVGGERREQCGGRKARRIEPVPAGATERLEPNAVCRSRNPGEIRARRHLLELDQNTLGDYRQTTDHFLAHGGLERARLRAQTTREECKRQEEKERRGEERRGEERTERFSFWPSPFTQTSEWGGPLSAA